LVFGNVAYLNIQSQNIKKIVTGPPGTGWQFTNSQTPIAWGKTVQIKKGLGAESLPLTRNAPQVGGLKLVIVNRQHI
tara:strand:- start:265 stop:495 length:231 start_codon:yes stop_codon:yes gene_type:complete